MKSIDGVKICNRCLLSKNISEYHKNKKHPDGLYPLCKDCRKNYARINKEKIRLQKRNHYERNRERIKKECSEYYQENSEKIKKRLKEYAELNPDLVRKQKRAYIKNRKSKDPIFKVRHEISRSVNCSFRYKKVNKEKGVWRFLLYTPVQLKQHLEKQFESWISWENHGKVRKDVKTWHIDHIIPQSNFNIQSIGDKEFLKCWSLENLRPLEAIENIKKGNKII